MILILSWDIRKAVLHEWEQWLEEVFHKSTLTKPKNKTQLKSQVWRLSSVKLERQEKKSSNFNLSDLTKHKNKPTQVQSDQPVIELTIKIWINTLQKKIAEYTVLNKTLTTISSLHSEIAKQETKQNKTKQENMTHEEKSSQ